MLPSNICISPDVGAVYSIRGFVDFHIEYKGGWVVELLRDADKRIAHMNRFTRNGRYYPIVLEVSEWAVVDIQGPQCSVSHPDVVDNLVVVKIDDQYTTASVRFGNEDLGIVQFVRQ